MVGNEVVNFKFVNLSTSCQLTWNHRFIGQFLTANNT